MDDFSLEMEPAYEIKKEKGKPCKGLIFRGYRNFYYSDGKIELKQGIRLLKRKSCPGCECCRWMIDEIHEFIDGMMFPEIEDGALYTLAVTNVHRDWESGLVDDYDLEVYKMETT